MIPILFPATETSFATNGLGRLSDAISCKVTEQRNDEYELEMEYPITGIHYELLEEGKIIFAKPNDKVDNQPFVIYGISKPINGKVTINAEHISYRLNKEVVKPFNSSTVVDAFSDLESNAIDCPFTFYTDKSTSANFKLDHPETIRKVLGGMDGSILDVYGGEYEWDKFTVKLLANRGSDNGVTLRYGKNITDLNDEIDFSGVYTACTPYWKNGDTVKYITSNPVVKTPYYDDFPYGLTVSLDCSQLLQSNDPDYVPTDAELTSCALNYMTANNSHLAKESIKVSFVPLYQTEEYKNIAALERVYLCDWVTVIYDMLGINVKMKVTETVYNTLLERYDSIVLGNSTRTLAKTVSNSIDERISTSESNIRVSLDLMRDKFFGAHDSFKYEERDADGNVIATYYMDTNDVATAQNIMRIDSAGIFFSQNGINGTFTSAWAINGVFNANFITAGTMQADRIKGGTLTLGGNNDVNGVIEMKDANNNTIGEWNSNGITTYNSASSKESAKIKCISQSGNRSAKLDYFGLVIDDATNNSEVQINAGGISVSDEATVGAGFEATKQHLNFNPNSNAYGEDFGVTFFLQRCPNGVYIDNRVGLALQLYGQGYASGGFIGGSARELKKNIKPYKENAIDKINDIDIVSFNLKDDKNKDFKVGFIADDTDELFATSEHNAIDYNNCIGMLLKAVQELSAKIKKLESKGN